ncbi:hypothetical protein [Nocardia phage NC1]|nr:hypothetical protein [Nocardia phage NC1]QSL67767.1 hypothetical protein [Nocardia phage P69]
MLRNSADLTTVYNRAYRTLNELHHTDRDRKEVQAALQSVLDALEHLDQVADRARLVRDIALAESRVNELKRNLQFYDTGVIPIEEDEVEPA